MLLNNQEKANYLEMLKRKNIPYLQKKSLRKKVHEKAKKNNICFNCGEFNGKILTKYYYNYYFLLSSYRRCCQKMWRFKNSTR